MKHDALKIVELVNFANSPSSEEDTDEETKEYEIETKWALIDREIDAYDARMEQGLDDWKVREGR